MVRRLLRKHGYLPDKQEQATQTVMEQAERLCETWADEGVLEAMGARSEVGAATVTALPVEQYPAQRPEELPLAAEPEPGYRSSKPSKEAKPSRGGKPRRPRK